MRNFNNDRNSRGSQGGGGRSFDRRNSGGGRSFDRRDSGRNNQMHDAVCADCGDNCKLPFRPSSGKPVYCSNCFEDRGNGRGDSGRDSRRPSFGGRDSRPSRNSRPTRDSKPAKNYDRQLEYMEAKLDKILEILSPKEEAAEIKPKVVAEKPVAKVETEAVAEEPAVEIKTEAADKEPIVEIETKAADEEPIVEIETEAVAEEKTS